MMQTQAAPPVVIVAYGNPLRADDGIGWHAAEILRSEFDPDLAEVICVHQLTPEIAEKAAGADAVIFLDASQSGDAGTICCASAVADATGDIYSHSLNPGQVLTLAKYLYGNTATAFVVSVTGESFDYRISLSETLQSVLPSLVATVKSLAVKFSR